jgi:hypothetical protein
LEEEEERAALRAVELQVEPHTSHQRCRHWAQQFGMRAGKEDTNEQQQQQERPSRREEGGEAEEEALMGQRFGQAEELRLQHLKHLRCH